MLLDAAAEMKNSAKTDLLTYWRRDYQGDHENQFPFACRGKRMSSCWSATPLCRSHLVVGPLHSGIAKGRRRGSASASWNSAAGSRMARAGVLARHHAQGRAHGQIRDQRGGIDMLWKFSPVGSEEAQEEISAASSEIMAQIML